MDIRPGHSFRPSNQQDTVISDPKDQKILSLQKMVEKLLLILAFLLIAFLIALCLLVSTSTTDTLRSLLLGIVESIISVLLIYIFRHQIFGSSKEYPLQKVELEQWEKAVDKQLEAIHNKQNVTIAQSTNALKQLEKQEKELASIKIKIDNMLAISNDKYFAHSTQLEQREEHISLSHPNLAKYSSFSFHQSYMLPPFTV